MSSLAAASDRWSPVRQAGCDTARTYPDDGPAVVDDLVARHGRPVARQDPLTDQPDPPIALYTARGGTDL